ncbi:MAG: hypothetical protein KDK97_24000, partial [Verrucomicrobiales bacterium]|nr:hypothetical protein [Verrucomicrobiales bacterium]
MPFLPLRHLLLPALLFVPALAQAQEPEPTKPSPWGDWVEKDFPFFSSVLDGRDLGEGFPKDNLTPRGLILNLGHNVWACYDTDLLRIAAIWSGEDGKPPVTADALAPGSYHVAGQKTKDGQDFLPKPTGKIWLANGLYAGWQVGEKPTLTDPRAAAPSPEEVGRGPLDPKVGRFVSVAEHQGSPGVTVEVDGVTIKTVMKSDGTSLRWEFEIGATHQPLRFALGSNAARQMVSADVASGIGFVDVQGVRWLAVAPRDVGRHFALVFSDDSGWSIQASRPLNSSGWLPANRWPNAVDVTAATASAKGPSFVLDNVPLPVPNPWKRNVRLADVDFLDDQGNAVGVTMDGDVWRIS